jgi:enoyl-CoA hydratase/carnithine racemase
MASSTETLEYHVVDNHVAVVAINRPAKLNTMTLQFFKDVEDLFNKIRDDKNIRVVVLHANGRIFCAGLDLKEATTILRPEGDDVARIGINME